MLLHFQRSTFEAWHLNKMLFIYISIISAIIHQINSFPSVLRIGGLFSDGEEEQELVFKYAVDRINSDTTILPRSALVAQVEHFGSEDSFRADKKVCGLLHAGVAAILGPLSDSTSMHVQSICDALEIPHIETRWDISSHREELSINLYPKPAVLARAYIDLVKYLGWKQFCVAYEDNDGLVRLQEFLKQAQKNDWSVKFYKFRPGKPYRETYWKIKKTEITNIVLDIRTENINRALKHAQQVGLLTEKHNYLVTSLDLHTVDLEDFKFGKTKISSFRLIDTSSTELITLLDEWSSISTRYGRRTINPPESIRTDTALIYDAVKLLATALQDLDQSQSIDITPISCENGLPWLHGSSLLNYMRPITFRGITGLVAFDQLGFRSSFTLDVMTVSEDGLQKIGIWNPEEGKGVNISDAWRAFLFQTHALENKTVVVTTILNEPFAMLKGSAREKSQNERYEGYAIDLIDELSKVLLFKYIFREVKDEAYGTLNETTGEWNGMIGELIRGEADLAIADLTITSKREEAVDFTLPFMNTGISILFRKPTKKVTTLFSFLSPFSMVVWVYVVGAYVGVSVILFVVGRLSPYEWDNPHPCRQDDQVLENDFSLLNSFWFTIGSLMQQGSDLAPNRSMSTRTIAGIWYFFTLIMISSYTANLAAFLTVEKVVYPIEDAKDLSMQTEIEYGCVKSGSTCGFFKDSNLTVYRRMYEFMISHPYVFAASGADGKKRVLNGNYAFLMESASIEYAIERECNLTQIGGLLDNKGYGIATRRNSPYSRLLSQGILQLQERGVLHTLKDRWWKQKRGGGACADDAKKGSSSVTELSLGNVGGVFVVLVGGLSFSILMAVCEFMWRARKIAPDRKSMCDEMVRDLKFALSCQSSTKPARTSIRYAGYTGPDNVHEKPAPSMPGFINY
ncbi:glutamate receptor ionotropic, kainate 2 isoform X1 [Tetranychus urticae]|uniref:glutamate receptor ionotropic, kainate 2 isoform X1 n=1 Tax=Tetranychus urticae TaxID=32264 RepID=UPI000D658B42|nr:glutamate receptor ionotropic, kainate 2 isoform X1 [Tetranychus urticae]